MKLKRTGIQGLDEFLNGGIPPSVVLLLGSPDKGHEIFARQIALFRSKQTGVTYFTVSKTEEAIKTDMTAYGMSVAAQEKAGKWKFIKLPKTFAAIKKTVIDEMKKNRCIVIDSLSELLLVFDTKEAAELVMAMTEQNNETKELHFILQTKGMQNPQTEITIQHYADGVIEFEAVWKAEELTRNLMIQKMVGSTVHTRRVPYSIEETGFTIETSTRIT